MSEGETTRATTEANVDRRRVLTTLGAALSVGIAGCGGRHRSDSNSVVGRPPTAWPAVARDAANSRYVPNATPAEGASVAWRAPVESVQRFPPVVTESGVFVLSRTTLSGFDRDGTERWSVPIGEDEYAAGAPTAHSAGDCVALATTDGRVRCLDAETGEVQVERTFAAELRASVVAPAHGRRLYVATERGGIHTLRRGTAGWTDLWTHETFGGVEHAPAVGEYIAVATTADIEVLDGQGRPRWRQGLPTPAATRPTLVGETVLVGTRGHALYAFDVRTGSRRWWRTIIEHPNAGERIHGIAATGERMYVTDSRAMHALAHSDGQRRWRHHDWDRSFGPPVATGQAVLTVDGEGVSALAPHGGPGVGSLRPDPISWRLTPDGSPRGLAVVGD